MSTFSHRALDLQKDKTLVYTAMSKHLFYFRMHISRYVLQNGGVPLNPFMVFDYFLQDNVDRDLVREGNNNLVKRSDELWIFGPVSNGVLAEVQIDSTEIKEVTKKDVELEDDVAGQRHLL
jgi:hypothetical protein